MDIVERAGWVGFATGVLVTLFIWVAYVRLVPDAKSSPTPVVVECEQ